MKTKLETETMGFAQRMARAEIEIERLTAQETQTRLHFQAAQAELQALNAQQAVHSLQKQTAQETITTRRQKLREAEAQLELAEGTLGTKPDVKSLEKLLKQAQQDQLLLLDRIGKEEQAQERRRLALEEAMERQQQTLITLAEKREAMELARARIWADYGQSEYDARLQKLNELQDALKVAELAVLHAKDERNTFIREATGSLQNWPEQQRQFISQLTYEDSLTHILEQELQLITTILSEGRGAAIDVNVARAVKQPYVGLTELVSIAPHYLRPAFSPQGSSELLEERQAQIEAVLSAHRAWKQGQ